MTRIREWLRQHTAWLRVGLWMGGIVVGVGAIFGGVFLIHPPSAFIVVGLAILGGATLQAIGEE